MPLLLQNTNVLIQARRSFSTPLNLLFRDFHAQRYHDSSSQSFTFELQMIQNEILYSNSVCSMHKTWSVLQTYHLVKKGALKMEMNTFSTDIFFEKFKKTPQNYPFVI